MTCQTKLKFNLQRWENIPNEAIKLNIFYSVKGKSMTLHFLIAARIHESAGLSVETTTQERARASQTDQTDQ